jgi:hypothetical protein
LKFLKIAPVSLPKQRLLETMQTFEIATHHGCITSTGSRDAQPVAPRLAGRPCRGRYVPGRCHA